MQASLCNVLHFVCVYIRMHIYVKHVDVHLCIWDLQPVHCGAIMVQCLFYKLMLWN